ncbi:MAG: FAD-binding oxidoreductase [Anaerolineales bacterium]
MNKQIAIELRQQLRGELISPQDPNYDAARAVFYTSVDKRPAAIVKAADVEDVKTAIRLAKENGLELAVRGGGHSAAAFGVNDGGLVLDMSAMQKLDLDAEERTAWAEAGLTAGMYTEAAGAHGLATGFGDTATVGIGGLTLGGGVGLLSRKYGLTIDSLLAAEIVTADGKLLQADEVNHAGLFWAIRGGGGNFGVATRFKFKLHPVGEIYGGFLFLPASPETITGFLVAAAEAAPEELTTILNVMPAPPMPFLPEELYGQTILFAMMVHSAGGDAGEKAMAPFRSLATPLGDMIGPKKYPEIFQGPEGPHPAAGYGLTFFINNVDSSSAQYVLDRLQESTAPIRVVQYRVLGGAVARVHSLETAYAHRKAKIMVNVANLYDKLAEAAMHAAWAKETAAGTDQGVNGAYVNFIGNEGQDRVRAAYPGLTWQRLTEIKGKYDPENLFRGNQNIPPGRP